RRASQSRVAVEAASAARKSAVKAFMIAGRNAHGNVVRQSRFYRNMPKDQNNLVWLDMEMTGLNPDSDRIIEVAGVITNSQPETVAAAPVMVVHQSDAVLAAMDEWNRNTHGRTGLIDKVKASVLTEAGVEDRLLEFVSEHVPARTSPLCGNSIC